MKKVIFIFFLLLAPSFAFASGLLGDAVAKPPSSGIIAWWSFDSSTVSGSSVSDLSGNSNTMTLHGTSAASGKLGQARTYNGSSDYAVSSSFGTPPASISVSLWFKAGSVAEQSLVDFQDSSSPDGGYHMTVLGIKGGALYGSVWGTDDITGAALTTGQWYNVVLTYDNASQTEHLYLNGVLQGSDTGQSWGAPSTLYMYLAQQQQSCSFNSACNDNATYFNGTIDDTRVYNRALTQAEVSALYNASASATIGHSSNTTLSTGLVGYWPFDGSTINWATGKVSDISGTGNTGHLIGMSTTSSVALGKIGQALNFNGTDEVELTSTIGFNTSTSPRSMAAWIRMSAGGITQVPFAYGSCIPNGGAFGVYVNTSNHLVFWGCGDDFDTNVVLTVGQWYHIVAVTKDGVYVTVYVNGVAVSTQVPSGSSLKSPSGTSYWEVGGAKLIDGTPFYWSGSLDDVRIYNRALSGAEVAQLYTNGGGVIAHSNTVTLSSGLIGYWPFDGNTTSWATGITKDISGQGNNGSLIKMSTTSSVAIGKIGQALKFNSSTSYVNAGTSVTLAPSTFTLSAWAYPTAYSNNFARVAQEGTGDGSGNGGFDIEFDSNGSCGDKTFYGVVWNGQNAGVICPSGTVSLNQWHHVVFTYDGTTGRVYIDGVLGASGTDIMSAATPTPFNIGRAPSGGNYFSGAIDDVRVYNRVLSSQEVAQLYAAGK